jgi:excisionase family DNA binding protein
MNTTAAHDGAGPFGLVQSSRSAASTGPLLVGLDEAAELLGLSERTVARLVADGELPSLKVGRRRLFSLRRLEEWAESRAADLVRVQQGHAEAG